MQLFMNVQFKKIYEIFSASRVIIAFFLYVILFYEFVSFDKFLLFSLITIG
jgi:hypothetical protein